MGWFKGRNRRIKVGSQHASGVLEDYRTGLLVDIDFSEISTLFKNTAGTQAVTTTGDDILRVNCFNGSGVYFAAYSDSATYKATFDEAKQNGLGAGVATGTTSFSIRNAPATSLLNYSIVIVCVIATNTENLTLTNSTSSRDRIYIYTGNILHRVLSSSIWQHPFTANPSIHFIGGRYTASPLFYERASSLNGGERHTQDVASGSAGAFNSLSLFSGLGGILPLPANSWVGNYRIYSSLLSQEEEDAVVGYLGQKWDIELV